ncbi:MAG: hypothetical protein HRU33_05380 [Rhodobacteraceae bacterium]|nr:hypothetical protein [Paracoccaceae bacterium]
MTTIAGGLGSGHYTHMVIRGGVGLFQSTKQYQSQAEEVELKFDFKSLYQHVGGFFLGFQETIWRLPSGLPPSEPHIFNDLKVNCLNIFIVGWPV